MDKIFIEGRNRLYGKIKISGMKNSVLPIIFATLLVAGDCIIENAPRVSDVENSLEILRKMGASADFVDTNTILINTKGAVPNIDNGLVSKMRASSYLMGAMLSRFGIVNIAYPGGCNFGTRPIEQHIKGFEALGAICMENSSFVYISVGKKLKSSKISLDKISVGATINMILASVLIEGTTVIENVANEPHVDDVIGFLNACGAQISRKDGKIYVSGVKSLHGVKYRIYSDMIEGMTYIACLAVSGGEIMLQNAEYDHINIISDIYRKIGINIRNDSSGLIVTRNKHIYGDNIVTSPYPGFPTDLHPQFASLLCYTENGGSIREEIFKERFGYVLELQKMGAFINKFENHIKIAPSRLHGAEVDATDLRAGAALVVAALGAEGQSIINNVIYIVRGYENMVEKLSSLGANIK